MASYHGPTAAEAAEAQVHGSTIPYYPLTTSLEITTRLIKEEEEEEREEEEVHVQVIQVQQQEEEEEEEEVLQIWLTMHRPKSHIS
jgi:arginine/lysine/ornithine decarboxylase